MLNVNSTSLNPAEFFGHLSTAKTWYGSPNYDKKFSVQPARVRGGIGYTVSEWSKYSRFSPLRLFLSPETSQAKIANAQSLAAMVDTHAKAIVADPKFDLELITDNLRRIKDKMVRNMSPKDADTLTGLFQKTIKKLEGAKYGWFQSFLGAGQAQGHKPADALGRRAFYSILSATWWPFRNNRKIEVYQLGQDFTVHMTDKPWAPSLVRQIMPSKLAKFLGYKATPSAQKIAFMENLVRMIIADKGLIIGARFNVDGMISNLKRLEGRITRNANPAEQKQIRQAIETGINHLKQYGREIRIDRQNDWLPWLWNKAGAPVWNQTAVPAWNSAKPHARAAYKSAKAGLWNLTPDFMKAPLVSLTSLKSK